MIGLMIIFWTALAVVFYAYLGYGMLLYALVRIKRRFSPPSNPTFEESELPTVALLVAAYNEIDFIDQKIQNSLALDYPSNKLQFWLVTDGSDDGTPQRVTNYPSVILEHQDLRAGKLAAVHRVVPLIEAEIIVFSDANTLLNAQAIRRLVQAYADPRVGAVAGEKRVHMAETDSASAAGEGLYWRYESTLKRWDGEWNSVVGAAGELFSGRKTAFIEIPSDSLIEDFYLTMSIAKHGSKVAYEPEAYAVETASSTVQEETKRKIRISAGAFQAMWRLRSLLNPFNDGKLTFQYVSHRVLRWTLAPLSLLALLIVAPCLAWTYAGFYAWAALLQLAFYLLAGMGFWLEKKQMRMKVFFVPYYFVMMNVCIFLGLRRYLKGQQQVTWEKAKRKSYPIGQSRA
ncbi:MAG: glycosyltransferase family 2 protein [Bacteroidota bacterium]